MENWKKQQTMHKENQMEKKTEAQSDQHGNTNQKIVKKKNTKKRSFEGEVERWEEMKREGKVDDCRLWLPLEVEGEHTLALYNMGMTRSFCGILVLLEKDGRKLGIHVVGLLAGFPDE